MTDALTLALMSPQLRKVAERAQHEPDGQFHALAHLVDERALHDAYLKLRPEAAVGVDGVTHERYGRNLEGNLRDLHQRLKSQRYRHQPIQRVHIPKEGGKTRPLGLSTVADKIVQEACVAQASGAGSGLRAGLLGLLVRLPARCRPAAVLTTHCGPGTVPRIAAS